MILETQILTAVIDYLNETCRPFCSVTTGGISPDNNGISAEIAPGHAKSAYLDGGVFQRLPILLLIKHQRHQTAMETAFTLAKAARNKQNIHSKVAGLSVGSAPEFVQRSGADYIYSLIINIDYMV
ncbi:MAG: hypothetical protein LBC82_08960 [Oscillospiraceae bacterium]|jgi:hypothetical protein|nr:hypothetical protein [Oscillospiraceae bacterium]